MAATIPTVNISPWLDANASQAARDAVVEDMRYACHEYGFFYLEGHGISREIRDQILGCAKLFGALPFEEKMEIDVAKSLGASFRGYEPPALQIHQNDLLPDTKEAFIFGREVPADDPSAGKFSTGPNQWPKSLSDEQFRLPLMKYHGQMLDLVAVISKILGRGLPKEWNVSPDIFADLNIKPSAPMRLLHYAPQAEKKANQFGVGDHTDFGNISVLLPEDGSDGLEVWHPPTQRWIPVPVKPDAYVINMGDVMQLHTAGYYRSARHRVINSNDKPRYSAPFFLNGNLDYVCRSLDGSGVETTVGNHIRQRLADTIGGEAGKKLIAAQ